MRRRIIHHHKHKKKKKIRKKKNKIKPRIFQYHDNKPTIVEIPKTEVRSHFLKPIVNLGCLNSNVYIQDIVPININWPQYQNPDNFATGSQGPTYALKEGNIVNLNTSQPNSGQPTSNKYSTPTPLQSSVQLTSNVDLYNIAATANGFGTITLSQEGLLWTLWPLAKGTNETNHPFNYFNDFTFGTSLTSRYPIGQIGYFYNSYEIACTPMTSAWVNPNPALPPPNVPSNITSQPGLLPNSPPLLPGVQGLAVSLLYTTATQVSIVVIKVGEEIARIFNPSAGISASERFIYVGYDAWSIFQTSFNPIGPMMSQTYISPQTVTGSITANNMNVVIPPNFPQTMYFKQQPYNVPNNANLFIS